MQAGVFDTVVAAGHRCTSRLTGVGCLGQAGRLVNSLLQGLHSVGTGGRGGGLRARLRPSLGGGSWAGHGKASPTGAGMTQAARAWQVALCAARTARLASAVRVQPGSGMQRQLALPTWHS